MSNFVENIGQDLVIALAQELSELTGESPSCLYAWMSKHGLPPSLLGARQTFYSRLNANGWTRRSEATSTEHCHLGSYPFSCELRVRAVSLEMQFRRDMGQEKKRQLILLCGYEICSQLLHFRLYRGPAYTQKEKEDGGVDWCEQIPAATLASFVEECARLIGLPLRRVSLTQLLAKMPTTGPQEVTYLSLAQRTFIARMRKAEMADNEVLCALSGLSAQPIAAIRRDDHPFVQWCRSSNATGLLSCLSDMVKLHNKECALPRLEKARKRLETIRRRASEPLEAKAARPGWPVRLTPLPKRMARYGYVDKAYSLHDMRYFRRTCEDFMTFPGDWPPKKP